MTNEQNIINCTEFEELLTDYLDRTLDASVNGAVGAHAMGCPLCHTLLNDVKQGLEACREISTPTTHFTRLEARVLAMTAPETAMSCEDFEGFLTEYLDGFLPAHSFHRWERHAALCNACEDLPGMVVRSIGACLTYKGEELPVPAGLHERILNLTLGTENAGEVKATWAGTVSEWIKGLRFPVGIPQLAPVAMMIMFAFLVFSQTVSADGSLSGVYKQGVQLAQSTYQQSADVLKNEPVATQTSTTDGQSN
jgi:anti-sigma factor RsiW